MTKVFKNNKGIVLISVYFVVVVLLGLSAVTFIRTITEARAGQRSYDALRAFYQAEAGRNYALAELASNGNAWYTHRKKGIHLTQEDIGRRERDAAGKEVTFVYPVPISVPVAQIETEAYIDRCYYVEDGQGNKIFRLKTYPERDEDDLFTDIVMILSQATVNGVTRTIEMRFGQASAYEYFFFFSDTEVFSETYDGRGYGKIHVNDGDMLWKYDPKFYFLTELTVSADVADKGFIRRPVRFAFPDLSSLEDPGGSGEIPYQNSISSPYYYNGLRYMIYSIYQHFYTGITTFKTGDYNQQPGNPPITTISIPYYLEDAPWNWDKYGGTTPPPLHFKIKDDNLYNLAVYEMGVGHRFTEEHKNLLSDSAQSQLTIDIPELGSLQGTEKNLFETIYNYNFQQPGNEDEALTRFWTAWKAAHKNDLTSYNDDKDYERKFHIAATNWGNVDSALGRPSWVNLEWWGPGLEYGTDGTNSEFPARTVNEKGEEYQNRYFLNTEEQGDAWGRKLKQEGLDERGEYRTWVRDKSQGMLPISTESVVAPHRNYDRFEAMAKNGGFYIGPDEPIDSVVQQFLKATQFYDAVHPAIDSVNDPTYALSNILVVDATALRKLLENGTIPSFNGVVYIETDGFDWSNVGLPSPVDERANGVMLVNAAVIPEPGLSLIAPSSNIYLCGNTNVDGVGNPSLNRPADNSSVLDDLEGTHNYYPGITIDASSTFELTRGDFIIKPMELNTRKRIATLSEDFVEPHNAMPLNSTVYHQYYDQLVNMGADGRTHGGYTTANIITHPYWGAPGEGSTPPANWMPEPNAADTPQLIKDWFSLSGVTPPAEWTVDWIENGPPGHPEWAWGPWNENDTKMFSFNIGDGNADNDVHILAQDLREELNGLIVARYKDAYAYDGTGNQTYHLANEVADTHIYNTAIVTPYSPKPYTLEQWNDTDRIMNGAYIEMPNELRETTPGYSYASTRRYTEPTRIYDYETRFGRGASDADRPPTSLTFGFNSSWREMASADFFTDPGYDGPPTGHRPGGGGRRPPGGGSRRPGGGTSQQ